MSLTLYSSTFWEAVEALVHSQLRLLEQILLQKLSSPILPTMRKLWQYRSILCSVPSQPTSKEQILLNHRQDNENITPLDGPLFAWEFCSQQSPASYLTPRERPCSTSVAEWQKDFFGLSDSKYDADLTTPPEVEPIRPGAPTLIAFFYPDKEGTRRPLNVYLDRIKTLAKLGEQTIMYVPPELAQTIKDMRSDKQWVVIDEYATVWDVPNNKHQRENFSVKQRRLYSEVLKGHENFKEYTRDPQYDEFIRNSQYDRAHLSACYNSKAFFCYDAVMRNPFGSDRWMFVDAGIFDENGPIDAHGVVWGDIVGKERLDEGKFDRSISISQDTGIVVGEYLHTRRDINHECWTDPTKAWLAHQFLAGAFVGSSLGILNYAVRYMQTVDDMDANDRYTGREEYVIPWVAIRYPNTIFSIPWCRTSGLRRKWEYSIRSAYTTYGGPETAPAMVDPISTIYCKRYQPRSPNLEGQGLYKKSWERMWHVGFKRGVSYTGLRPIVDTIRGILGLPGL